MTISYKNNMFSNYFFVPANKSKFLIKSEELNEIDNRIFDFEDSIICTEIDDSLNFLAQILRKNTDWIRLPFNEKLANKIVKVTSKLGYNNYVIPKFNGYEDLKVFIESLESFSCMKYILLIENSKSLLDLECIIKTYKSQIHGVGLGSHDFSFITGIENNINLLRQIRINILLVCKAYGIEPIDVASMNILNMEEFNNEVLDGFRCGYRAKFILHPNQLNALRMVQFYNKEQIKNWLQILNYFEREVKGKEALFTYDGKVYEKMHIEQIKKIVKWGERYYGTNR
ncbi:aldolase/citrate lyase family protein [Tissierella praeacuta]|uniref:aldolase/citrate lyase family protein n=1 Tax=Tissierella praeacuta TaxID=43131 RepID=UPI002FD94111